MSIDKLAWLAAEMLETWLYKYLYYSRQVECDVAAVASILQRYAASTRLRVDRCHFEACFLTLKGYRGAPLQHPRLAQHECSSIRPCVASREYSREHHAGAWPVPSMVASTWIRTPVIPRGARASSRSPTTSPARSPATPGFAGHASPNDRRRSATPPNLRTPEPAPIFSGAVQRGLQRDLSRMEPQLAERQRQRLSECEERVHMLETQLAEEKEGALLARARMAETKSTLASARRVARQQRDSDARKLGTLEGELGLLRAEFESSCVALKAEQATHKALVATMRTELEAVMAQRDRMRDSKELLKFTDFLTEEEGGCAVTRKFCKVLTGIPSAGE